MPASAVGESAAFWSGRSVLVTGVGGYLARRLGRELQARGALVYGLDLQPPPPGRELEGFDRVDLTDTDAVAAVLERTSPRTAYHLAGQSGVADSERNPAGAFEANVEATWSFLEACRQHGHLSEIVFTSSNHVYGRQERRPTTEDAPLRADGVYGASKACADIVARAYAENYGLPVVVARITNTFDAEDPHLDHLIPGTIAAALAGERPVIRGNGTALKGFVYVDDTIDALVALAEAVQPKRLAGEAFNVFPDTPITVRETVDLILRLLGREDLEPEVLGDPSSEEEVEHLSNEKIKAVLGWRPSYSLEEGLLRAIADYREKLGEPARARAAGG